MPTKKTPVAPALDERFRAATSRVVSVDLVSPWPDNPRVGDIDAIAASLERFGQVKPLVVQKSSGLIVAGNQTYKAAVDNLGWTEIIITEPDLSDVEAKAFVAADNRLADVATYDDALLVKLLTEVSEQDGGLDGTGFEVDDVEDLVAALGNVPADDTGTSDARHTQDDDQTERRYAARTEGQLREVILMMPDADYADFKNDVEQLKVAWGVDHAWEVIKLACSKAVEGTGA